ncbi:hypothetical protein NP233_g7541 [Leucocoprinus birnbaumii]|uniref:F-box domain-containing protein n=1 Tax=Leucocoprinus birnbaumii TaxID=56174 RepID=A0AAD5YNW9_9AGAR|nr:hypothetical protein NP233_g7541 [Leucocoprinus birnbaumii]
MLHDNQPLIPLSFDRVAAEEPITSTLPLFQLPVEILHQVTPYLSPLDIQRLSLVDRDSHQLSRALQFAHVTLDYSDRAIAILSKLKEEVEYPACTRRRLGTCIRRLRVSTIREYFNVREGITLEELEGLSTRDRIKRVEAAKQREACYLRSICDLLQHLPNLHILDWNDESPLTEMMMASIMSSSIRHLRLDGPILNRQLELSCNNGCSWPLEGLYLNVGWSLTSSTEGDTAPFVSNILKLVAPTLHQFIWCGYADRLSPPTHHLEEDIQFPVLRDVVIDQVKFKDASLLGRVFHDRTRIRSLSVDSSSTVSQFLASRGRVPSLDSFRWDWSSSSSDDEMIDFIHSNSHLSCLEVTKPLLPETFESIFLRNHRFHFDNLVSLHLVSQNPEFPSETLSTIASITSLQHLWLSAGAQYGMRYQWAIDHDFVMESLKPLERLETLVFTRDSYRVNGHPLLDTSPERYYMNKVLPQDILLNDYLTEEELSKADPNPLSYDRTVRLRDALRCLTWERWHQTEMVMYATEYSRAFTNLKWCFMGQLMMRVDDNMFWRVAELEVEERDPSLKMLHAHWDRTVRNVV